MRKALRFGMKYWGSPKHQPTQLRSRQSLELGRRWGPYTLVGYGWEGDRFIIHIG